MMVMLLGVGISGTAQSPIRLAKMLAVGGMGLRKKRSSSVLKRKREGGGEGEREREREREGERESYNNDKQMNGGIH